MTDPDRGVSRVVIGATESRTIVIAKADNVIGDGRAPRLLDKFDGGVVDEFLEKAGMADPLDKQTHVTALRRAIDRLARNDYRQFSVNGKACKAEVQPRTHLADFLREKLNLTGTHLGCEHGVCGACTLLVDGVPTRSCITFAVTCQQAQVTTIEGLETTRYLRIAGGVHQRARPAVRLLYAGNGRVGARHVFIQIRPSGTYGLP